MTTSLDRSPPAAVAPSAVLADCRTHLRELLKLDTTNPPINQQNLIAALSGWAGREDGLVPMHDDVTIVVAERLAS